MIDKSNSGGKDRKAIIHWLRFSAVVLTTLISLTVGIAQGTPADRSDHNQKIDEYEELNTDDEAARLDVLVERLSKDPDVRGCILSYSRPGLERGSYLRRIYGIARYLTESRGIEANRILLVDGGYKDSSATELWLVPQGEAPPPTAPTRVAPRVDLTAPYKFDEECLECGPAVALDLYGLDEGLRFYAEVLRDNPTSRALIIVRPGTGDVNRRVAVAEARQAKRRLVSKHEIEANRISIRLRNPRADHLAIAEMWIMPRAK
jgi:hypothetical protein